VIAQQRIPALLVGLALLSVGAPVSGQEQQQGSTVTVEGTGAIVAGDRAKAEEDAVNDAFRNAVEQVMGVHVASHSLVENFQLIEDRIYTRTRGYVSAFEVLDTADEGDLIRVRVRVTVKEADLVSDLEAIGLLLERMNYPRLLVLIDEQVFVDEGGEERAPTTLDVATTTTALMEAMQPKGFRFVEPSTVANNTQANVAASALSGDASEAVTLGRAYQADVIILGRTVSRRGALGRYQPQSMVSMQVVANLRVLRADTGEIIARADETGAHVGNSPLDAAYGAIRRVMDSLSTRIEEQILEKWSADVTSGTVVELVIVNEASFMDVQKFISLLPYYVRGAEDVTMKNFAEGMTMLELRFAGDATGLASELSTKSWDEFEIVVAGVTANRVRVRITPKGTS
jgi:hypothetical protein